MGDLGDALELMHDARSRFTTLRATIRDWSDGTLQRRAAEKHATTPEARALGYDPALALANDEYWRSEERQWRLWVQRPDQIREERGNLSDPDLGIRNGKIWWTWNRHAGAYSNEDDPSVGNGGIGHEAARLIDPSPLLALLRFKQLSREPVAGREAIILRAEVRGGPLDPPVLRLLPARLLAMSGDIELAVDAERGILLRRAALVDGRPYSTTEVVNVAFDETFPPKTFTFVLPPGEPLPATRPAETDRR